jgi:hypothetical protein
LLPRLQKNVSYNKVLPFLHDKSCCKRFFYRFSSILQREEYLFR